MLGSRLQHLPNLTIERYNYTHMASSLEYIEQLHKPKMLKALTDSSDNWLAFRTVRYDLAGECEYAVLRDLDLSGYKLPDFKVSWLAFVKCNLDGVPFRGTEFIQTAFINCSMRNADFTETIGTGALFVGCDLTGARFSPKSPYTHWASEDLDGNSITSIFEDCKLDESAKRFLAKSDCLIDGVSLTAKQRLDVAGEINERLHDILAAPVIGV